MMLVKREGLLKGKDCRYSDQKKSIYDRIIKSRKETDQKICWVM
ncbi:uncharacterized protein METZ01_LOCUS423996 [marine metagenome]|uniref:Uncharacterized protein n=1 Tax=marine metagenome TaxID=408172 RepID=A0A382XJ43_9ZZZZ